MRQRTRPTLAARSRSWPPTPRPGSAERPWPASIRPWVPSYRLFAGRRRLLHPAHAPSAMGQTGLGSAGRRQAADGRARRTDSRRRGREAYANWPSSTTRSHRESESLASHGPELVVGLHERPVLCLPRQHAGRQASHHRHGRRLRIDDGEPCRPADGRSRRGRRCRRRPSRATRRRNPRRPSWDRRPRSTCASTKATMPCSISLANTLPSTTKPKAPGPTATSPGAVSPRTRAQSQSLASSLSSFILLLHVLSCSPRHHLRHPGLWLLGADSAVLQIGVRSATTRSSGRTGRLVVRSGRSGHAVGRWSTCARHWRCDAFN